MLLHEAYKQGREQIRTIRETSKHGNVFKILRMLNSTLHT